MQRKQNVPLYARLNPDLQAMYTGKCCTPNTFYDSGDMLSGLFAVHAVYNSIIS